MAHPAEDTLTSTLATHEASWLALLACVPVDQSAELSLPLVRCLASRGKDFEVVKYCISREVFETRTYE